MKLINSFLLLAILILSACDPMTYHGDGGTLVPEEYSTDAVKQIRPDVSKYDDDSAHGQDRYVINSNSRLLLRFEALKSHSSEIMWTDKDYVEFQISIDTPERAPKKEEKKPDPSQKNTAKTDEPVIPPTLKAAQANLHLCPLTRTFMMLATWYVAHPFGTEGRWSRPGGDFDASGCVQATRVEDQNIVFDIKRWFLDYVKGRDVNHGFVLIGDAPTAIFGDSSGSYSPRIRWSSHQKQKTANQY